MKILYAGNLAAGTSALFRLWALRRMGHEVVTIDPSEYFYKNQLVHKVTFRLQIGPKVERLNREILRLAMREKPDVFWGDKVLSLKPDTLVALRGMGIVSVSYMIDNAFGPRQDPGWRLFHKDVPLFDLHVTQRDVSVADFKRHGARDVMKVQTAYEPMIHFPSSQPVTDAERTREVSFVGTPYDDRAEVLAAVAEAGLPVVISGNPRAWERALGAARFAKLFRFGELYETQYREAMWHSKINVSFLTKANQDEYTHKSFEIAGCGGFLLAERCAGHSERFVENEEAVFFGSTEELIAQCRRWLPDEQGRARVAAAGQLRAERDGYHNDRQVGLIVERLEEILAARASA